MRGTASGGVGANTMNDKYYSTSKMLTPALRDRFFEDEAKLTAMHVDIALPSHPNQLPHYEHSMARLEKSRLILYTSVWFIVKANCEIGREIRGESHEKDEMDACCDAGSNAGAFRLRLQEE